MIEQATNEFRNQITGGEATIRNRAVLLSGCTLVHTRVSAFEFNESFEQHAVGTTVRVHYQPLAVAVIGYEISGRGGFRRVVHQEMHNSIDLGFRFRIVRKNG